MNKPFDKTYWKQNYSEPQTMDGIGNALDHARYLKAFFNLEGVDVDSVIDFGCGYAYLLSEVIKAFGPVTVEALEPSPHAYAKASKKLSRFKHPQLNLKEQGIQEWCDHRSKKSPVFDLGICTSVFQYISNKDLTTIIPILSRSVKYLYLTVPTEIELGRQIGELEFHDTYALHRSRAFYQKVLKPHFTIISSRILESKHFYDEKSSPFTDLLYRH